MRTATYDLLTFTSFPSSMKLSNDEGETLGQWWVTKDVAELAVVPGSTVKIAGKVKLMNVSVSDSEIIANSIIAGVEKARILTVTVGRGARDWFDVSGEVVIPPDVNKLLVKLVGGSGPAGTLGETWFDELKVYQSGVLIYTDDFSNWNPIIGAGVGAPIGGVAGYLLKEPLGPMVSEVVGAVVGGALGGGIGLLTGLGIIPVPQIPSLGATPEGPVALARLGKYQITG